MSHKKHKAPKKSHKPEKNLEKPPPAPPRAEQVTEPEEIPEPVLNQSERSHEAAIDMYAREAAAAIDGWRSLFPLIPSSFFEIAQTNSIEFVRMQMRLLELMANQSKTYIGEVGQHIERAA